MAIHGRPCSLCFFDSPHQVTPLHIAANSGQVETVRWLVEQGADVNIQTNEGVGEYEYTAHFKLVLMLRVSFQLLDHEVVHCC